MGNTWYNQDPGISPIPNTGNLMKKLFEFTANFEVDKFYTFYVTDTGANTAGFTCS